MLEQKTGVELVTVVVDKADAYPEILWKAFALGTAIGALLIWLWGILRLDVVHWAWAVPLILGFGASAAILVPLWPAWARLFLDRLRAEAETEQYARSLFLSHEIFSTPDRTGMLLLVSRFERRVIVLPDRGAAARLESSTLQAVIAAMTERLRRGEEFEALRQGVADLEACLIRAGFSGSPVGPNRLPDTPIQLQGDER
jgi:putative membrane protein